MQTVKPIPTPWKHEPATPCLVTGNESGYWILTEDEQIIAHVHDRPEAEANAHFIVRAVNSHDELVYALEKLIACDKRGRFGVPNFPQAIEQARVALAKVKGEARAVRDSDEPLRNPSVAEQEQFERWRDEQLDTLRKLYRKRERLFALSDISVHHHPHLSFPDFCRQQWEGWKKPQRTEEKS